MKSAFQVGDREGGGWEVSPQRRNCLGGVCSMNRRQGEEGVQRYSRERPRQEQDWSVRRTAGRGGWGYSDTGGGKGVPGGGTA